MKIFWLGHSCFNIIGSKGISILTDPFDEAVGYSPPRAKADIVVVSHDHHDHNNVGVVRGNPAVVRGPGKCSVLEVEFKGVETYHDDSRGKLRGANTVFCFQLDAVRACHLGDLGHVLSRKEVEEIGPVDLLFIPVGGVYTIDAAGADQVVEQLRPRIIIPMHYQTEALTFELDPVENFLKDRDFEGPLECLELKQEDLTGQSSRIVLLKYSSV